MGKKKARLEAQMKMKYNAIPYVPDTDIVNPQDSLPHEMVNGESVDLAEIEKFRTISKSRDDLYNFFDEMAKDTTISTALEMYAEDCTSYNDHGQIIWAESDDPDIQRAAQRLIDVLKIPDDAFYHILSLVTYGDVYLELFYEKDPIQIDAATKERLLTECKSDKEMLERVIVGQIPEGARAEEYVEMVSNPAEMFDLSQKGKSVGFVRSSNLTPTNKQQDQGSVYYQSLVYRYNTNDTYVYPPTKYVHISLRKAADRYPEKVQLSQEKYETDANSVKQYEFSVVRGKSILYDVYKVYQELSLLEDSLMLNRLLRSAIVRLFQVEVGDMPRKEINTLLRRIKSMMDQKTSMNANTGSYRSYISSHPVENNIYMPTKNGKGAITNTTVGGDVDVKSIVDIEYFRDKLSGGLRIPKQYLGLTDDATGFNGGSSLTKIDSRYARTIKRIQTAYISGITNLINIIFASKGQDKYINNFKIRMNSPSAIEDQERAETLSTNVGIASDILAIIDQIPNLPDETKLEIIKILFNDKVKMPEIDTVLGKLSDDLEQGLVPTEESDEEDLISGDDMPGGGGSDLFSDDYDADATEDDTTGDDGGSEFPEDLSDEDLDLSDNDAVDNALGDEET